MSNQNNENGDNFNARRDVNINYNYGNSGNDKKVLTHDYPNRVQTFVGRGRELQKIIDIFDEDNRVLLSGIGGIGKSAIAKEFLNRNSFDYKAWINYKDSLTSSIVNDLNSRFDFSGNEIEVYNKIIYELNNLNGNNLMIIDNFDNPTMQDKIKVKDFLPNFKILITSRSIIDDINMISIEKLNDSEAIKLFEKHCKKAYDKENLENLLKHIDNHSLLIELIAKTIQKSNLNSLESIYSNFKDKKLQEIKTKIDFKDKSDLIIEHIKTLFSLDSLTKEEILILKKFAILPSVEINFNDLIEMFKVDEDNLSEFENELNELVSKGWISANESNYKIHQLIIEFINLEKRPNYEEVKEIIYYFGNKLYLESGENPIDKFKYIIFAKNILETIKDENEEIATLSNNLSTIYYNLGDLKSALEFAKKSNEIREKVLDKNHPLLASSYNNLSMIYKDLGKLQSALEFAKKANEIYEKVLDKNHPLLATSYSNLAVVYRDSGDLDNALYFSKKSLKIREKVLDKNHPNLATSYIVNSYVYQALGDFKSALEFAKKANEIYEKVLDKNHPLLATLYNNLSMIYKNLGDLKSALEFAKKSLEIREKTLDKNHPDLATSYNNISLIYKDLGEYEKAKEYMNRAIKILETIFPNGHPNLDIFRENLRVIERYL